MDMHGSKGISMSNGRAEIRAQSNKDGSLAAAVKFVEAYQTDPIDRVRLIKQGIPADVLEQMATDMLIAKSRLAHTGQRLSLIPEDPLAP